MIRYEIRFGYTLADVVVALTEKKPPEPFSVGNYRVGEQSNRRVLEIYIPRYSSGLGYTPEPFYLVVTGLKRLTDRLWKVEGILHGGTLRTLKELALYEMEYDIESSTGFIDIDGDLD